MSQEIPASRILQENTIIDADVHLSGRRMANEKIVDRLEEPHRSHVRSSRGAGILSVGYDRNIGGKIDRHSIDGPADIQRDLLEKFSIDCALLSPSLHLTRVTDDKLVLALMEGYNDVLIEDYLEPTDDLYGLAVVATRHPEEAAEELRRVGSHPKIVGTILVPGGTYKPLGDPRYDPMYQAAEDEDLTVVYHAAAGTFPLGFPRQYRGFKRFVSAHTMNHVWAQMETAMSLLENGTPEKFPGLSFVFLEAGITWIPVLMFRLNKEYSTRRSEMPMLTKRPEEYMKDFYYSTQPMDEANDPADVQQLLEIIDAPDTLMFSSDYPHHDFDSPDELGKHLHRFSADERERILSGNASEAFGIDV